MFSDPFGGFFFWSLLTGVVPLLLIIVLVVVFVARPKVPDPHGRRPYAIYLFSVLFVSVLTLLAAIGILAAALAQSLTDRPRAGVGGLRCSFEYRSQSRVVPLGQEDDEFRPPDFPTDFPTFEPPRFRPIEPQEIPTFDIPTLEPKIRERIEELQRPEEICLPTSSAAPAALRALFLAFATGGVLMFHAWRATDLIAKEASDA